MTTKKWINVGAIVVAFVAIVVGLCFYFFGNKPVEGVPKAPKIEQIDNDYYLVADFNGQYKYKFKLEQFIGEEYVVVDQVVSDVNSINLSQHSIGIVAGQQYRFSVCYVQENGAGNEEFSPYFTWKPSWNLAQVTGLSFDTATLKLSWNEVFQADFYTVCLIDEIGKQQRLSAETNSLNLRNLEVGSYYAYVLAESNNDSIFSSSAGSGVDVVISKKNEILSTSVGTNNVLDVTCSQRVYKFQILVDDELKATVIVENCYKDGNNFKYKLENLDLILKDLTDSKVEIRSVSTEFVKESDLFVLPI